MKKVIGVPSLMANFCLALGLFLVSLSMVSAQDADHTYTLHTDGNQLVNSAGEVVRLLGVAIPYLSWGHEEWTFEAVDKALDTALSDWNINVIRLAVNPEFWLDSSAAGYKSCVDGVIKKVAAAGKYIILDNHSFHLPGQESEAFWKDAAVRYKDHPHVLFELFNEPADCTWQQYFEGGTLSFSGETDWGEPVTINIESQGIPHLLKTLRKTGASNVVILSGPDWGFDLSYMTEANFRRFASSLARSKNVSDVEGFVNEYVDKYFLKETTGNGIMYATHPYPGHGYTNQNGNDWDKYLKDTISEYPVIVGECGPTEQREGPLKNLSYNDKRYLDELTSYISDNGLSLAAWSIGAWPFLNAEPDLTLSAYGEYMRDFIGREMNKKAEVPTQNTVHASGIAPAKTSVAPVKTSAAPVKTSAALTQDIVSASTTISAAIIPTQSKEAAAIAIGSATATGADMYTRKNTVLFGAVLAGLIATGGATAIFFIRRHRQQKNEC